MANLRPPKDQVTLVRAIARVARTHAQVQLLLVGHDGGGYGDEVRAEVERQGVGANVALLGLRTDVASLLAACDIGVLSSTSEGTPLAVIEYGLAGLPVVATDVGEVAEVLDGQGRLVPPGDADALAHELIDLLDDPDERRRSGHLLQARLDSHYSAAAMGARWAEVYRTALERRATSDSR